MMWLSRAAALPVSPAGCAAFLIGVTGSALGTAGRAAGHGAAFGTGGAGTSGACSSLQCDRGKRGAPLRVTGNVAVTAGYFTVTGIGGV